MLTSNYNTDILISFIVFFFVLILKKKKDGDEIHWNDKILLLMKRIKTWLLLTSNDLDFRERL